MAEVARQRVNSRGKYLKGLIPWLNAEPWDQGEATPAAKPDAPADWQIRMWGWTEYRNWRAEWGPEPGKAGCAVPAEFLNAERAS